jgi:hypothetical protein
MKRSGINSRNRAIAILGAGLALLFSVGSSVAQPAEEFQWTPRIEREVFSRVTRERVRTPAPVGFSATVGEEVPATVELYEMPSDIEYAAVRSYRYMVHDDRLYIVDPDTRKVVRVIN